MRTKRSPRGPYGVVDGRIDGQGWNSFDWPKIVLSSTPSPDSRIRMTEGGVSIRRATELNSNVSPRHDDFPAPEINDATRSTATFERDGVAKDSIQRSRRPPGALRLCQTAVPWPMNMFHTLLDGAESF